MQYIKLGHFLIWWKVINLSPFYWENLTNAPSPRPTSICVLKYDVVILFPLCQLDLSPLLFYDEDIKEAQNGPDDRGNLLYPTGPRLCVLDIEAVGFGFNLCCAPDKPGTFIGQVFNVWFLQCCSQTLVPVLTSLYRSVKRWSSIG